ncbi:phosphopantetheine-binding protein [Streptococcus dentiloxodontae]
MITKEDILNRMRQIIRDQMGREDITLTSETALVDLGIDSIELMEFIINLEDDFEMEISDETIDDMTHVSDLVDYLYAGINA